MKARRDREKEESSSEKKMIMIKGQERRRLSRKWENRRKKNMRFGKTRDATREISRPEDRGKRGCGPKETQSVVPVNGWGNKLRNIEASFVRERWQ